MSRERRCELTDLLVESCAHCHPDPGMESLIRRATKPKKPGTKQRRGITAAGKTQSIASYEAQSVFQALMADRCIACSGPIEPGDWVRPSTNHINGLVHKRCV